MSQFLSDLAGDNQLALQLLGAAEDYRNASTTTFQATAAFEATHLVGQANQTKALTAFYELADAVDAWHALDLEPQRPGIDADLEQADVDVLYCLFSLMWHKRPCRSALGRAETVDGLHATRFGWPSCGKCGRTAGAA